jgi:hypothetical protein
MNKFPFLIQILRFSKSKAKLILMVVSFCPTCCVTDCCRKTKNGGEILPNKQQNIYQTR